MAPWIPNPPSPPATPAPRVLLQKSLGRLGGLSLMLQFSSDPKATPPIFPNLEKSPQIGRQEVKETKAARARGRRRGNKGGVIIRGAKTGSFGPDMSRCQERALLWAEINGGINY